MVVDRAGADDDDQLSHRGRAARRRSRCVPARPAPARGLADRQPLVQQRRRDQRSHRIDAVSSMQVVSWNCCGASRLHSRAGIVEGVHGEIARGRVRACVSSCGADRDPRNCPACAPPSAGFRCFAGSNRCSSSASCAWAMAWWRWRMAVAADRRRHRDGDATPTSRRRAGAASWRSASISSSTRPRRRRAARAFAAAFGAVAEGIEPAAARRCGRAPAAAAAAASSASKRRFSVPSHGGAVEFQPPVALVLRLQAVDEGRVAQQPRDLVFVLPSSRRSGWVAMVGEGAETAEVEFRPRPNDDRSSGWSSTEPRFDGSTPAGQAAAPWRQVRGAATRSGVERLGPGGASGGGAQVPHGPSNDAASRPSAQGRPG